jgi:Zn-dependent peptidase ImmA (M78 family)
MKRVLPKRVDFGFAVCHIELMDKRRMRELAECEEDDNTPEGLFDGDMDTVYVGKWLRSRRKREAFMHELAHFCLDWRDEGKCE